MLLKELQQAYVCSTGLSEISVSPNKVHHGGSEEWVQMTEYDLLDNSQQSRACVMMAKWIVSCYIYLCVGYKKVVNVLTDVSWKCITFFIKRNIFHYFSRYIDQCI
jgi:hypothetical protein